jgi:hypothetical protein
MFGPLFFLGDRRLTVGPSNEVENEVDPLSQRRISMREAFSND